MTMKAIMLTVKANIVMIIIILTIMTATNSKQFYVSCIFISLNRTRKGILLFIINK